MKRNYLKQLAVLLVLAVMFLATAQAAPPVILTVTPSVVSNTYPGAITLESPG